MSHVGLDMGDFRGQQWLVMVDRYSGWLMAAHRKGATTANVIEKLTEWFNLFGWPSVVRVDGGPCFKSSQFYSFCRTHGISREVSSPYNSPSNGAAESGIKQIKHLLTKTNQTGEDFDKALAAYRNTPRADGFSAAQLMFGRRLKGPLPMIAKHLEIDAKNFSEGRLMREKEEADRRKCHDSRSAELPKLSMRDEVIVQDIVTKKWNRPAEVVSVRESGRSYELKDAMNGKYFIRNRKFLRRAEKDTSDIDTGSEHESTPKVKNIIRSEAYTRI